MKWINVKDELPPINKLVLCMKKSNKYFIGSYIGASYTNGYAAFKHAEKDMAIGVSHWMSLPKPPNEYERDD